MRFPVVLLFTPFTVTRFAMHRIYADRINSRGMSRVFCDLCSQKTRGMLPMNSNLIRPLLIHLPSHKIHTLLLTTWILLSYPRSRYMSDSVKRGSSDRCLSLLPQLPSQHSRQASAHLPHCGQAIGRTDFFSTIWMQDLSGSNSL